jgi:HlyD family secretion protein
VLRVPNAALRFRPPAELVAGKRRGEDAGAPARGEGAGRRDGRSPGGGPREPDRRTVWVLREGVPGEVGIRTGVSDGSTTEVVEGELREGDRVITEATGGGNTRSGGAPGGPGLRRIL